jgi:hypothetical protein
MASQRKPCGDSHSYGIGEWYGRSFVHLSPEERRDYAVAQSLPKKERPSEPCIPRSTASRVVECTKDGGICSLRQYKRDDCTKQVSVAPSDVDFLCTTCPYRFYEDELVFRWIGETVLGHPQPAVVPEVDFLMPEEQVSVGNSDGASRTAGRNAVGRIDHVLVHPDTSVLTWCAVEMQAVYFSGDSMKKEFDALTKPAGERLPFPAGRRRPDFRSSGPKRLMPQLQIKVPTLRRWGKRMCVVVDASFFYAMGPMEEVDNLSNCDIAWFVVGYEEDNGKMCLRQRDVHLTTLEHAVRGLTAGRPVSLSTFEAQIREKLDKS